MATKKTTKATKADGGVAKAAKAPSEKALRLRAANEARLARLAAKREAEAERVAKLAAPPATEARPLGAKRPAKKAAPRSSAARVLAKAAEAEARLAGRDGGSPAAGAAPAGSPAESPSPAPALASEAPSATAGAPAPAPRRRRGRQPAGEAGQPAPSAPNAATASLPAGPGAEPPSVAPSAAPLAEPAVLAEAVRVGSPEAVRQRTIALCLECSLFGDERRVPDSDAVQTEADRKLVTVTKRLIECDEYDRIRVLRRQAADIVRLEMAFPSFFKPGIFLVPVSKVRELEERLRAKRDEFDEAVRAFAAVYPERVEAMRSRLGPLFNSRDYPSREAVAARFSLSWRYLDLDAPHSRLSAIDPALAAEDAARASDFWREAADGVARMLRATAVKLAERVSEVLTPGPDGKPRAFRRAAVEGLMEFLRLFGQNNVADDRELAAAVERAQALLADVDVEHLKSDEAARAELGRRFDAVRQQLAGLTATRGAREVELPAA